MRQLSTILIVLYLATLNSYSVQEKKESLKITDFEFKSIIGTTTKDPKNIYCLLGTGFFRAARSANTDSLITEWIKAHATAFVIPVSSIGQIEIKDPEITMTYCWIIDNNDTLNNYLIKNGCFPGGTMIRPKTWDEMEKWEKELYRDINDKPNVKVFVAKNTYDNFIEQIKIAEQFARENKLGIWLKETDK